MVIIQGLPEGAILIGTTDDDELYGNNGNDRLDGRGGFDDFFAGGKGNDLYIITNETNVILEAPGEGADTVLSSADYFTLRENVENLTLIGDAEWGAGNGASNIISGNDRANVIFGFGGDDVLTGGGGNDVIRGGAGNDWIKGGKGADYLVGNRGADKFTYFSVEESTSAQNDTILDFSGIASSVPSIERDRIDLHRIDANLFTAGDDAFHFIGTTAFTGKVGELHIVAAMIDAVDPSPSYAFPDAPIHHAGYLIEGDVNGDGAADFQIAVVSTAPLKAADFYL